MCKYWGSQGYTACNIADVNTMIRLREYEKQDAETNLKYANNPNVARFLLETFPSPYTLDDSIWWTSVGHKELTGMHRAIDLDGECIGSIGVTPGEMENRHTWEIGYWIGEPHWKQGYGSEALGQMTEYVFQSTDAKRLYAPVLAPNKASMRILEKCGYKLEGVHVCAVYRESEGGFLDEHVYARIRP